MKIQARISGIGGEIAKSINERSRLEVSSITKGDRMKYIEPKEVNQKDIIKAFNEADIPFDKIVKSKLGGFYVYTPYGMQDSYLKYTIVEQGQGYVKKLWERISVKRCFIDNQDLLNMSIAEAKTRKKG